MLQPGLQQLDVYGAAATPGEYPAKTTVEIEALVFRINVLNDASHVVTRSVEVDGVHPTALPAVDFGDVKVGTPGVTKTFAAPVYGSSNTLLPNPVFTVRFALRCFGAQPGWDLDLTFHPLDLGVASQTISWKSTSVCTFNTGTMAVTAKGIP